MHIPDDPLFYEKFYFTPGDLGFRAFDTACGRIGTLVCWDQWYPEAARLTALAGADVLFYPTAIGWHPSEKAEFGAGQASAWQIAQRAHAIANGVYVAAVNRVGHEKPAGVAGDGLEFWGGSFVADPFGQVMRRGVARQGRDADRHLRSPPPGDRAPELAVPARSPHRRLRRDHAASARRMKRARVRLVRAEGAGPAARRARLPHARRVGAARGDLDRLAARGARLAGQAGRDRLGLRRGRAPPGGRRARAHPGLHRRRREARARGASARRRRSQARAALPGADRPQLDARLLPALRHQPRRRGGGHQLALHRLGEIRRTTSATTRSTTASSAATGGASGSRPRRSAGASRASCWKAARSTSTAPERC